MESVINRRRYTKFSTEPAILLTTAVNIVGLFISLVYRHEIFLGYPLFGELLIHIILVEWNVHKQQKRIDASQELLEKSKITEPIPCIGQVVGYREDPTVFKKCLLGYENDYDKSLKVLVIGIDGNDSDDLEMVHVADEVFGSRLGLIELDEPFGFIAEKIIKKEMENETVTEEEAQKVALQALMAKATEILREKSLLYTKKDALQIHPICITQPHACKKDILFTSFIFTHALALANDIEFIWSSDSDSWVLPNTISSSIAVVYPDQEIAGTCTALEIHNSRATVIAQLVGAVYWADLAMSGGSASAADANDCQCGPSSLFRRDPMREVLLSWYLQVFLNQRPIVNEDRHMTSRLLLAGWMVTYNPFGFVETDTPPRSASWCSQQIRWQRATIIEFFAYPGMFFLLTPVLTMSYSRKIFSPLENMALVIEYLFVGRWRRLPGIIDLLMRITTRSLYTAIRNPSKDSWFITQCFAPIFLQFPQSAFLLYSMMTMFENRWGTAHRSVGEQAKSKTKSPLLKNPGSLLLVSVYAGLVIAACTKYFALLWLPLYTTTLIWTAFLGTFSAMLYIFAMDI